MGKGVQVEAHPPAHRRPQVLAFGPAEEAAGEAVH